MKKGRYTKTKKYTTIVFIPHAPSRVKTFKFSSLRIKISLFLLLTIAVSISLGFFINDIIEENRKLKEDITALYALNFEQKDMLVAQDSLLDDHVNVIKDLQGEIDVRDSFIMNKINEVLQKYKEITDTYIEQRIDTSLASRSSDRTNNPFAADINELKLLLKDLYFLDETEQSEDFDISESITKLEEYLACIPTFVPTEGRISSGFGYRTDPITKLRKLHNGVDFAANHGTDIRASGDGKVIFAGYYDGYGNTVIIDHGFGLTTLYGHTSKILVKNDETVEKGQLIAKVGSTGRSTGPHLHFEIRINDNPVDPLEFLDNQ